MSRTTDEREILAMLSYARPMGSATEQAFIDRYLTPLGFKRDTHLNLYLEVLGPDNAPPRVMFSSHVDTVDRKEGIKTLHYDGKMARLSNADKRRGFNCLGADDTSGVWLMVQMIRAGVPGLYLIHHGEENGCVGSSNLAAKTPEFLDGVKIALAFDRAGYGDVITHQCGYRTASQGFAWSLARQLGGAYKPDDGGVYTDTNEYAHLVPECSNLSVGYKGQHGQGETQDVPFLIALRDKLLAVDWDAVNVERDPNVVEGGWDRDRQSPMGWRSSAFWDDDLSDEDYLSGTRTSGLEMLVRDYPIVTTSVLEAFGVTEQDLVDEIERQLGTQVWRRA